MKRLLFSIALAAGLALVAFGCAPAQISLPNTVSAGKITMGYPDGFTAHGDGELRQTISTKLDGTTDSYEQASASVLNEDYSAHIALDQYDGRSLDEVRAEYEEQDSVASDERKQMFQSDEFQEFAGKYGLDSGWYAGMLDAIEIGELEPISLGGCDGFRVTTTMDLADTSTGEPIPSVSHAYWLTIDEDSVASIIVSGEKAGLEKDQAALDAMLASVRIG